MPFEQSIEPLMTQLDNLRHATSMHSNEIKKLKEQIHQQKLSLYKQLTPWQICHIARHPERPRTRDIIQNITRSYVPLSGVRHSPDDPSMMCGLAMLDDQPMVICGQEKGRTPEEKMQCHFGMNSPAGFRKALRCAKIAEKFKIPLITIIDTPGALPTVAAEESNQSEAIARNIFEFCQLKTPVISIILGEGMSGGALAIGTCDTIAMFEYAVFSAISPEGCAAILWKDSQYAPQAAESMKLTAPSLFEQGIIDTVLPEPEFGAHMNMAQTAHTVKDFILSSYQTLKDIPPDALLQKRRQRYDQMG